MPGTASILDPFAMPGMGSPSLSAENEFLWGNRDTWFYESGVISSVAVDSGSTPLTTTLRPGLLMAKIAASGLWKQYDPTATDGSQIAQGILRFGVNMLTAQGVSANKSGLFVIHGFVKNQQIYNLDYLARRHLAGRFLFDDDYAGLVSPYRVVKATTANYQVATTDNDCIFTNEGATGGVTFTLPAVQRGLRFQFCAEANFAITVAAAAPNTMVLFNNPTASQVALATANKIVGGWIEVIANADATKWLCKISLGDATQVETIS